MNQLIDIFTIIIEMCMAILNIDIEIFGLSFTMWSVFVFVSLGSLMWYLVSRIYGEE